MYFEGELPVMSYGNGGYNNGNNGWNDWSWIIGLALVGGLFGNGGFGFGGGNRTSCATQSDLAAGFNNSAVLSNLNDIILGQAQAVNFSNQGFAGVNATVTNGFANLNTALCSLGYNMAEGFHGVDTAICNLGYQQSQGFFGLQSALDACCCKTQGAIADLKYANERQTCDLINNQNANTRAILDYLTNEKIEGLRAENVALKGQISNDRQSQYIVSQLREPCPVPSYIVPNPNCCYQYGVTGFGYGGHNGCCGASVQ